MGVKPLLKIYGTIGAGYLAAHKGVLTPQSEKTISWMVLYFFIPALIFYNIVSYITDTDIEMLGIIFLSGAIYYVLGLLYGILLYFISPIPRGWIGGLLLCAMVNNSSDLPVAYVQTIGSSTLMPEGSSNLGSAYAVLFSTIFYITTFNLGGSRLVEWDFTRSDPYRNEGTKPFLTWKGCKQFWKEHVSKKSSTEDNPNHDDQDEHQPDDSEIGILPLYRRGSSASTPGGANIAQRAPPGGTGRDTNSAESEEPKPEPQEPKTAWQKFRQLWNNFEEKNHLTMFICHFIEDIKRPQMLALISAIACAMIPWVKRCFSNEQTIGGFRDPPDGLPPLDFIMVFLSFLAGAQIPLGLIMVGSNIKRLKLGRLVPGFKRTAFLLAAFKLAILPIIACGWIVALRQMGWIDKNDPLAAVVLAVDASTPSATVQIYLTELLDDPNGERPELNAFGYCLIIQYLFLPISIVIVVAFVLKHFSAA